MYPLRAGCWWMICSPLTVFFLLSTVVLQPQFGTSRVFVVQFWISFTIPHFYNYCGLKSKSWFHPFNIHSSSVSERGIRTRWDGIMRHRVVFQPDEGSHRKCQINRSSFSLSAPFLCPIVHFYHIYCSAIRAGNYLVAHWPLRLVESITLTFHCFTTNQIFITEQSLQMMVGSLPKWLVPWIMP